MDPALAQAIEDHFKQMQQIQDLAELGLSWAVLAQDFEKEAKRLHKYGCRESLTIKANVLPACAKQLTEILGGETNG